MPARMWSHGIHSFFDLLREESVCLGHVHTPAGRPSSVRAPGPSSAGWLDRCVLVVSSGLQYVLSLEGNSGQ